MLYQRLLLTVIMLLITAGCAIQSEPLKATIAPSSYRSALADEDAKALYAYAEFRLLAVENRWDEAIAALRRAVAFDPTTAYLRMSLAKALLHKGEADESIEILRQILRETPDNVEGHELLGDLLSYQGENEAAVEHYRQALVLDPDNEMLRMRLAMTLGRSGRSQEAIALLEELVAEQPDATLAQLSLARFYRDNNQLEKATQLYRELLDRHPDQQQAVLEYGRVLEGQGDNAGAFALYRQTIREYPRAVAVRQQLALLYLKQNRKQEALEQYLAVRQLLPGQLQLISRTGLLRLDLELWSEAEADFRLLLEQQEDEGRTRYYLGLALLGQKKYTEAITVMAPIEESSPVFVEAVLQLAYLYRQADQLQPAIAALEKLLARDIHKPEVYYYLTSFYADEGQLDQADQVVSHGLEQFPQNLDLLYQSAVLAEKQGDRMLALERMRQVLKHDADHADALNFIAYHHAEKGTDLESALVQAQKALAAKQSGYIVDTLGWIYFKLGRFDESREQLEKATSLLPEDPIILEHLGDLYRALSLWQQAAEAYRRALQLDPLAEGVEEKLQRLPLENCK